MVPKNGAVSRGAGPLALTFAGRERGADHIHPAETDHEEDHRRHQPHGHTFEKPEDADDDGDDKNDAVVRPGQCLAACYQPVVQQTEPEEEHQTAEQRLWQYHQRVAAEKQHRAQRESHDDPGEARFGAGRMAHQRHDGRVAAGGASAQTGNQVGSALDPKLPVHIEFRATAQFQRAHVQHDAHQGNEGHTQDARELGCHDIPVHMIEVAGLKGRPGGVRGYAHKHKVLALVDRDTGRAKSMVVDDLKTKTLAPILKANIAKEATVYTDEAGQYRHLDREFADHAFVRHGTGEWGRGPIHTNTIEGYFSIFKRGMKGVYQHCAKKHLHRYAAEFEFRYNNREANDVDDNSRTDQLLRGSVGKRLQYS